MSPTKTDAWLLAAILGAVGALAAIATLLLLAGVARAQTCYWVGGTGNTTDSAHWASATGGTGGTCAGTGGVPDVTHQARFDSNSFSAGGQTVTTDAAGFANTWHGFDWTGATNSPTWSVAAPLGILVDADCALVAGMTLTNVTDWLLEITGGDVTVTSAGHTLSSVQVDDGATMRLADDIVLSGGEFQVNASTFYSNNHAIRSMEFDPRDSTILHMGTSTLTINQWLANDALTTGNYEMGSATLDFAFDLPSIGKFNCDPSQGTYGIIVIDALSDMRSNNNACLVGAMTLLPGSQPFSAAFSGTVGSLTCIGTSGSHITLNALNATFGSTVACQYADVTSSDCEGVIPCYAGSTGTVDGTDTNWLAQDAPATPTPTNTPTVPTETPTNTPTGPTPTPTQTGPTRTPTKTPIFGCCVCGSGCANGSTCDNNIDGAAVCDAGCDVGNPTPCTATYHAGLTCASGCGGDWPTPTRTPTPVPKTHPPTKTPTPTRTGTPTPTSPCPGVTPVPAIRVSPVTPPGPWVPKYLFHVSGLTADTLNCVVPNLTFTPRLLRVYPATTSADGATPGPASIGYDEATLSGVRLDLYPHGDVSSCWLEIAP